MFRNGEGWRALAGGNGFRGQGDTVGETACNFAEIVCQRYLKNKSVTRFLNLPAMCNKQGSVHWPPCHKMGSILLLLNSITSNHISHPESPLGNLSGRRAREREKERHREKERERRERNAAGSWTWLCISHSKGHMAADGMVFFLEGWTTGTMQLMTKWTWLHRR